MINQNNKFNELREAFPFFVFENFLINISDKELEITYVFNLSNRYSFKPSIRIPLNSFVKTDKLTERFIHEMAFHIGLIELLSYWKCTCSPKIIIKKYALYPEQIAWLKKLYYNGLGEFFYTNNIMCSETNFVDIETIADPYTQIHDLDLEDNNVIPMGGGKDSAVTYHLLSQSQQKLYVFFLNPQHIPTDIAHIFNTQTIAAYRTICPQLIALNNQGFLNGHTPFSAILGLISVLISALTSSKHIVLSNESSANEATVVGTTINHQYSKTYEFEEDFRYYITHFIAKEINYFSFLRPLNEFQIAALFSKSPVFFNVFRSCNVGSKKGVWCCGCPKCLFTYIILSPFIAQEKLIEIFGENLFDNSGLKSIFNELIGLSETKPFECVGTLEEVNTALTRVVLQNAETHMPKLLLYYKSTALFNEYSMDIVRKTDALIKHFNTPHFLPENYLKILQTSIKSL